MNVLLRDLLEFKQLLSYHPMFTTGILLLAGYVLGRLVAKFSLPEITGYIVAGLLVGEAALGLVPREMGESFRFATEVALGLIALTIGGEFSLAKLRRMGRNVVIITIAQILITFLLVSCALLVFRLELPYALLLGAVATATAPAATVAIVQSLRAHGVFVDHLYGVVALDDAGCVIVFGFVFAFVSSLLIPAGAAGAPAAATGANMVLVALSEVTFSIALGLFGAVVIHLGTRRRKNPNEILIVALGSFLLFTAVAIVLHLSPLLTNMAAGFLLINLSARNHRIFRILEPLTPPLYALFFVIAGTELEPGVIFDSSILILGAVYIVSRAVGKYGGVFLGSTIAGAPQNIRRYLGLSMLPQAGVAIGLVLLIQASPLVAALTPAGQEYIHAMVNIVLLSVFINELLGPPLSKFAVIKGNEMKE